MSSIQGFRTGAAATASKVAAAPKPKKIKKLSEIAPYLRIFLFGKSGTGKSYIIAQLLEAGKKVLVLDSDVGGNGLNTVRSYLKEKDKLHLMDNCLLLPIESYEDAQKFVSNAEATFNSWVEGTTWAEFSPDWIVWDGFGNFQQVHIWNYALQFDGGNKETEQRSEGVALETKDWQTVMKATHFAIDDFGRIVKADGSPIHKIWSSHLDDREVDPEGKKIDQKDSAQRDRLKQGKKPLLAGKGAAMVVSAADYVIRTFTKNVPGGKTSFCWDMTPAEFLNEGKVRGAMLKNGPVISEVVPIDRINEMLQNINAN